MPYSNTLIILLFKYDKRTYFPAHKKRDEKRRRNDDVLTELLHGSQNHSDLNKAN